MTWPASEELVDKVIRSRLGIAGMQLHIALGTSVLAGTPGNDHDRVSTVVERPFDGNFTSGEDERPKTLPTLSHHDSYAVALVGPDLGFVGCIVNRIGEGQQITGRIALGAEVDRGIRIRMLDHLDALGRQGGKWCL